jgi:putative ABC transport system permease protein
MDAFWQDMRHAVRGYLQTPLFTIVVLGVLGLGIGANSAIFSIVHAVLLRPLDYPRSSQLVSAYQVHRTTGQRRSVSPPNYFDLKEQARAFSGIAAYWSPGVSISGAGGDPEHVLAATCSSDLFGVLGVAPAIGRGFLPGDDVPGALRVAIIGHGLWQRRFGGERVIGRELTLDGIPTVIIGVMPGGFAFPSAGTELWVPLWLSRTQAPNPSIPPPEYRQYRILNLVARVRDGFTLQQARAEVTSIGDQLERRFPGANHEMSATIVPLHEVVVGEVRPALLVLLAAVGCVLLIACANVGSLLLVRASRRSREIAIRMALGAGRSRLVRQMLTESVVLAIAGGVVGLVVSAWSLGALLEFAPAGIPRLDEVGIDGVVVAFTLLSAAATGLAFGIAPAFQVRAQRLHEALLGAGRGTSSVGHHRARQVLVVGEVALSLMLLIGASLLVQSFLKIQRVDTGLRMSRVLTIDRIELPRQRSSPPASAAFFDELLSKLRAVPGIESAGMTLGLPLDARARFFVDESTFSIEGRPPVSMDRHPTAPLHVISPDYFATIGVPLKRGRWFTERDRAGAPGVVIINEAMARRYWPDMNPIGRRISHDLSIVPGQPTVREIVGVVGDVRHFGLEHPAEPQMFVPHRQMPWPSMAVVIRSPLDASHIGAVVREAVRSLDDTVPVPPMRPLAEALSDAVGQPRFRAWLLGLFAMTALLLAVIGLYGTMAYATQQRTREIGLRIALGATPGQATRLLLRGGLTLAVIGVGVGLGGSVFVSSALAAMLYGVGATDPASFVGVPAIVVAAAAVACYIPARHAQRVDPIRAINSDA